MKKNEVITSALKKVASSKFKGVPQRPDNGKKKK